MHGAASNIPASADNTAALRALSAQVDDLSAQVHDLGREVSSLRGELELTRAQPQIAPPREVGAPGDSDTALAVVLASLAKQMAALAAAVEPRVSGGTPRTDLPHAWASRQGVHGPAGGPAARASPAARREVAQPAKPAAAAAAPVASAARGPAAAGQPAAARSRGKGARRGSRLPQWVADAQLRHSFEMVLPVEDATMFAYGGGGGTGSPCDMFNCGDVDDIEEADVARWRAEDAEDGVSLPVRLAKNVLWFLHEKTDRRGPKGGVTDRRGPEGVVSASFINAKAAAGPLGVAPRWGGVLRVLVTVASDAVADTVVRGRHALRLDGLTSGVYDVLSDREEAQHRALWPAFRKAKAAGKRPQFHRAPRD
jgi:hypothetical protein